MDHIMERCDDGLCIIRKPPRFTGAKTNLLMYNTWPTSFIVFEAHLSSTPVSHPSNSMLYLHLRYAAYTIGIRPGVSAETVLRTLGNAVIARESDVFRLMEPLLLPPQDTRLAHLVLHNATSMVGRVKYAVHGTAHALRLNIRPVNGSGTEDIACVTDSNMNGLAYEAMPPTVPADTRYTSTSGELCALL